MGKGEREIGRRGEHMHARQERLDEDAQRVHRSEQELVRDEIFHLAGEVDERALACADWAAVVWHRKLQRALDFDSTDLWGREGEWRAPW